MDCKSFGPSPSERNDMRAGQRDRTSRYSIDMKVVLALMMAVLAMTTQAKPRARDLGIPFDGTPGRFNAITDVAGVEVGHVTLISGSGKLVPGKGPVRTGVTSVFP